MDPYDSDSSGFEEDGDYTETGVLLGYPSEEIIEDTISHLGGWPTWIDDATPPPGDLANCKVCNSPMTLLLQLHGDLPDHFPDDERRLYIFACPRKPCNRKPGSIRALRAVRRVKSQPGSSKKDPAPATTTEPEKPAPAEQKPKADLGASLFGANNLTGSVSASSNPFAASGPAASSSAGSNPFATPVPATTPTPAPSSSATNALAESFASKVRVSSPPPDQQPASSSSSNLTTPPEETSGPTKPWPARSAFPDAYKEFYLDAEYEALSRPSTPTVPENVTIDNSDEGGSAGGMEMKDALESQLDKAFIKFSTRLAHNPEQILRYEFRGTPLLYSHADAVGKRFHDHARGGPAHVTTTGGASAHIPRCEYCGASRVFELQLVPHAISVLEEGREGMDAGMEWGTIILGVCSKDCGPKEAGVAGWREEWAGVQWEEAQ